MTALLYGHDVVVATFVRQVMGGRSIDFGECRGIGVLDAGHLIAGAVFHDWNPERETIELSIAAVSRRWMTRDVVAALGRYAFDGVGVQLVWSRTSERNRPACRILSACGFRPFTIPRFRGRDEAEVIYTLTAEDWRDGRFARV